MPASPPKVVIVGRTNVGKSTLFNKLIEEQKSLVSDVPGTTRDRYEGDCIWRGQVVRLIDTGGLDVDRSDEIERNIAEQARLAIKEADLILFVVDVQSGIQPEDRDLAKELQETKKPVIVVGNKADNRELRARVNEKGWFGWSFGQPIPVSAGRGIGTGDLLDETYSVLEKHGKRPAEITDVAVMRVAVIGKPNVGKSSLLNAAVGETRFIASEKEHTTREPNDTMVTVGDQNYLFIDTAGIRKMAKVRGGKSKLEKAGVERTLRMMKRADVALFLIDISKRIQRQDKHLAGQLADAGTSVVVIANKWDLIPDKDSNTINEYEEYIRAHLPMLSYAPILFTSAKTGQRVPALSEVINKVYRSRFTQLDDEETKSFISRAIKRHRPTRGKGVAHPQIMSFKQVGINPPKFHLKIRHKREDVLAESYLRFLQNLLRKYYDFEGTPIIIKVLTKKKSHTT